MKEKRLMAQGASGSFLDPNISDYRNLFYIESLISFRFFFFLRAGSTWESLLDAEGEKAGHPRLSHCLASDCPVEK